MKQKIEKRELHATNFSPIKTKNNHKLSKNQRYMQFSIAFECIYMTKNRQKKDKFMKKNKIKKEKVDYQISTSLDFLQNLLANLNSATEPKKSCKNSTNQINIQFTAEMPK